MYFPVGTAPKLKDPLTDQSVVAPGNASLTCAIDRGEPKADVKWFKDAKEVYRGRRYDISATGQSMELTIKDIEVGDTGKYRCEASNALGRVQTEGKLKVCGKSPSSESI